MFKKKVIKKKKIKNHPNTRSGTPKKHPDRTSAEGSALLLARAFRVTSPAERVCAQRRFLRGGQKDGTPTGDQRWMGDLPELPTGSCMPGIFDIPNAGLPLEFYLLFSANNAK